MVKEKATSAMLLEVARAEVGYLEKKSNSQLDDKTTNAGSGNYTKYARDLDAVPGFYNGRKNGFDWCDVFVDWCFVKAFGVDTAKKLLCQPEKSLGAGCRFSANYYKEKGQFFTKDPKPGDQIFFWNSGKTDVAHTGIVYGVDGAYVYTVEGNTSAASGVIANGGGVAEKKYALTNSRIYGYGRPSYDTISCEEDGVAKLPVLSRGCKGESVRALQILLLGNGCPVGKWGADGDFGAATENALKTYQQKNDLTPDGIAGPVTWGSLLGIREVKP